jgi:anti-anti-sigma regulatory factor
MRDLLITVEPLPEQGVLVVRPVGRLTLSNRHSLRSAVLKCLSECPAAVVVDVSDCVLADRLAVVVFVALRVEAATGPGIAVLLCGARGVMGERIEALTVGHISYPTLTVALSAIGRGPQAPSWRRERFLTTPESVSLAGCMITDACVDWGRPDLVHPARAVMFELIHDAFVCAPSELRVIMSQRPGCLALSVRSPVPQGHWEVCALDRDPHHRHVVLPTGPAVTYYRTATSADHLNWALMSI